MTEFRECAAFNSGADVLDRARQEISVFERTSCATSEALITEVVQLRGELDSLRRENARIKNEIRHPVLKGVMNMRFNRLPSKRRVRVKNRLSRFNSVMIGLRFESHFGGMNLPRKNPKFVARIGIYG